MSNPMYDSDGYKEIELIAATAAAAKDDRGEMKREQRGHKK